MRVIYSPAGWFNSNDDSESALVHAESTDLNEVAVEIESNADWKGHGDERPKATVHLNPIAAIELAEQLRHAAIQALDPTVMENLP